MTIYEFRKEPAPALGPSFGSDAFLEGLYRVPGGPAITVDTDKLTLDDFHMMRSHPQINASLTLISFMVHQVQWDIECKDKKIARVVEENLNLIWTRLIRAISEAYWAGYSPCVLEWKNENNDENVFISKVMPLEPEEAEVNWLEVESSYTPPREYNNVVKPKIKVYDGIKKMGLSYPIPPEHTFWYPLMMRGNDYGGTKLLKSAFVPWYFSILIHLYANRYFERFGEPVPIGRAPFQEEFTIHDPVAGDKTMNGKQVMEEALMHIRSRGAVVLPSDRDDSATGSRSEYLYDVEYLESAMRGADFERYLSRLDEEISLSILTPMLLLRSGGQGSYNLGVQHAQTWMATLNALATDLKEYIDRYICERIKMYNFSINAPRVEWIPRRMGKDNPDTIRSVITTLLRDGAAKVDFDELSAALGMTVTQGRILQGTNDVDVDARGREERVRSEADQRGVGETRRTESNGGP